MAEIVTPLVTEAHLYYPEQMQDPAGEWAVSTLFLQLQKWDFFRPVTKVEIKRCYWLVLLSYVDDGDPLLTACAWFDLFPSQAVDLAAKEEMWAAVHVASGRGLGPRVIDEVTLAITYEAARQIGVTRIYSLLPEWASEHVNRRKAMARLLRRYGWRADQSGIYKDIDPNQEVVPWVSKLH